MTSTSALCTQCLKHGPLLSMLIVSELIYQFVNIRRIVEDHEFTVNGNDKHSDSEKKIVEFKNPALVVTDNSAAVNPFKKSKLKHAITAAAIREFLELNRNHIKAEGTEDDPSKGNIVFDETEENTEKTEVETLLEGLEYSFDADIIEYDDSHVYREGIFGLGSELLYSVIVNRSHKRITVCFRGTAFSDGLKDAVVDLLAFRVTPDDKDLEKISKEKGVKLHEGFYSYLYKQKEEDGKESKFDHICDLLEEVYKYKEGERDYSNYSLYITGHSLGGALAQLLAFGIAGTDRGKKFLPKGKPVIAVTYASAETGNSGYQSYFNELERDDKVRHLRVSNKGDVVPFALGLAFWGYKQPGVNIHVVGEAEKPIIGYNKTRKAFALANPLAMHGLETYRARLPKEFLEKTVEQFYADVKMKKDGTH